METVPLPIGRLMMNLSVLQIYKYAKEADIILTNTFNACLPSFIAAKLAKKPVVCLVHGVYGRAWTEMRGPIIGNLFRIIERIQVSRNYNKIIFLAAYAHGTGMRVGVNKNNSVVVNPGAVKEFKFKQKEKEPFVLFVGRLSRQKNLDLLLDVAAELDSIKFVLVGKGEEMERLKKRATNNVEFLGFVSDSDLKDLYERAAVFFLPSLTEGFGFVILEAMSAGCAVVSTVPLGYAGYTGNGLEFFKKSIHKLIMDKDIVKRFGAINREAVKKFNWKDYQKKLDSILTSFHKA